jgi:hypothetical protein
LVATKVAERMTAAAEEVRAGLAAGTASTDTVTIAQALRDGRVATLLVHDDGTSPDPVDASWQGGARVVDRAIDTAFATDADVLVVPRLAVMDGPLAAILRW